MNRVALVLVALSLTAAACGGSGDGNADRYGPAGTTAEETANSDADSPTATTATNNGELSGSDAVLIDRFTPIEFADADGTLEPVIAGREPWFEFFPDGTMTGNDGCNDYTATFSISGPYEGFGQPGANSGQIFASGGFTPTTDESCPDDVVARASELVAAIDGATRWVWNPPTFILLDLRANELMNAMVTP
ncbi:MAG: META domain-containing protein [Acidimicrobiales bacterium]